MDLRERIAADAERIRGDLERLVRLPSIAFAGFPREPLDEAAELVGGLLREAGAPEVRLARGPGQAPPGDARVSRGRPPGPPCAPHHPQPPPPPRRRPGPL